MVVVLEFSSVMMGVVLEFSSVDGGCVGIQ